MRMPYGKYKGLEVEDVPDDYLLWALGKWDRINPFLKAEIQRVLGIGQPPEPSKPAPPHPPPRGVTGDQIDAVFRSLSRTWHPDRGGTTAAMQAISQMRDELLRMLPR